MSKTTTELITWMNSTDAIKMVLVEVEDVGNAPSSTVYLSSKAYTTTQGEIPELVSYNPSIISGLNFNESISLDGEATIGYGDIEISNHAGDKDSWLHWVWTNRTIRIYLGDPSWARQDFYKIFDGLVSDISASSRDSLNLVLLNKTDRLNMPVSEKTLGSLFPGNVLKPVGAEQNRETILPLCFGECFNVSPLLISSALTDGTTNELIYMVHDGAIESIIEVRDNGVPLTPGVGYTVNLLNGTFQLLRAPAGTVTCSVQGSTLGGTYSNKIADIVKYIVMQYGPVSSRFILADIDETALTAFNVANPQAVGIYLTDRENVLDVCQRLAKSVGANVVCNQLGKLKLAKLHVPGTAVSDVAVPTVIDENNTVFESLSIGEKVAVKGTIKLGYCFNWTTQESGMAGAVPPSSLDLFKEPWLYASQTDALVTSAYKLDTLPVEEETMLLIRTEAEQEALRRLNIWKTARFIYQVTTVNNHILLEVGNAVTISNYRYSLNSTPGVIVSIDKNWFTGETTLGVLV